MGNIIQILRRKIEYEKIFELCFELCNSCHDWGVFYREFTKWNGYTGVTMLGKVHTHLFLLGMLVFLIVAIFAGQYQLREQKMFRVFLCIYDIGVPLTAVMMFVRGITEVKEIALSKAANGAISEIAGIGHVLTGLE